MKNIFFIIPFERSSLPSKNFLGISMYMFQRIWGDFGLLIQDFRAILHAIRIEYFLTPILGCGHVLAQLVIGKDHGQLLIESAHHSWSIGVTRKAG